MKRLVVCCDGTWNAPEKLEPKTRIATNVLRMSRLVRPRAGAIVQVTEYVRGIGTGNLLDKVVGGITGKGISSNILQAYQFLSNNFEPGDQIFLFGFSRGAYTARSLSGFLATFGILKKKHQNSVPDVYRDYQRARKAKLPEVVARYREMTDRSLYSDREYIPIHFLGVWDTVGALGVPSDVVRFLLKERIGFHDTELAPNVTSAYHALAIHEFRAQFPPTLWTRKRPGQVVEQVWFPGAHSDVGGGVGQEGLPSTALLWMAGRAEASGLELDRAELAKIKANPLVPVSDSRSGLYRLSRPYVRPIGPAHTDANKPSSLDEHRHESVDERLQGLPGTLRFNRDAHAIDADTRAALLPAAPPPQYY